MSTKTIDESKRNDLLRIFIEKFPKSDLAMQVRCIGLSFIKTNSGFAGAMSNGNIKNAIDLADSGNRKRLVKLALDEMGEKYR